jgi:hypothetical protein
MSGRRLCHLDAGRSGWGHCQSPSSPHSNRSESGPEQIATRSAGVTQRPSKSQHAGMRQVMPGVVHGERMTPHPQDSRPGTLHSPPGVVMVGLETFGQPCTQLDPMGQASAAPGRQGPSGAPASNETPASGLGIPRRPSTGLGPGKSNATSTHSVAPVVVQVASPPSGVTMLPGVAHIRATYRPGATNWGV